VGNLHADKRAAFSFVMPAQGATYAELSGDILRPQSRKLAVKRAGNTNTVQRQGMRLLALGSGRISFSVGWLAEILLFLIEASKRLL
jgi:hypothetical protein